INNPHVLQVEDGKQGVIRPDVVAVKQSLDPAGLLNPGKLRGWQHAVISLIAEESEGLCASLLPRHRGSNAIRQASDEARTRNGS
ncbi:hypothetical protein, partial [Klebsiella pneumoniae]|uniref:hypothetical protein n=1 Tax=Klebsiella pneumoniae TaxID=573 RepID=UPI00174D7C5A